MTRKKCEKHGYSKTKIYTVWEQMKSRCNNKNLEDAEDK